MTLEQVLTMLLSKGKTIIVDDWIISKPQGDVLLVGRGLLQQHGHVLYPEGARVVLCIDQALAILAHGAIGE